MTLTDLMRSGADLETIAKHLDGLEESARYRQVIEFPGSLMGKLYDLAASRPTTVESMFPEPNKVVVFSGKNSLPMFTRFSKAFLRKDGADEAAGHNRGFTSFASGPGYFVARNDPERKEVAFDYRRVPLEKPEDWPTIQENKGFKIGTLVYGNMVDYNRWVSSNTVVGRATKGDDPTAIAHYLVTRVENDPNG